MSMKNSNDTIGNRFRDLPVCSAVPQPLRHSNDNVIIVTQECIQEIEVNKIIIIITIIITDQERSPEIYKI
jgi:hypothetical protein